MGLIRTAVREALKRFLDCNGSVGSAPSSRFCKLQAVLTPLASCWVVLFLLSGVSGPHLSPFPCLQDPQRTRVLQPQPTSGSDCGPGSSCGQLCLEPGQNLKRWHAVVQLQTSRDLQARLRMETLLIYTQCSSETRPGSAGSVGSDLKPVISLLDPYVDNQYILI